MIKYTTALLALAASISFAAPAAAQRYDAFDGFTGSTVQDGPGAENGINNGNFIYGQANPATGGASFFSANTNCFISGSICLQAAPNGDVPGVAKGGSPAFQYNSVFVPQDRLLVHPNNTDELTIAAFVAPTAGVYRLFATFNVQDINPSGVDIFNFGTTNGGPPLTFSAAPIGSIDRANPTFTTFQQVTLGASEAIGYGIGRQGTFNNDSTGLSFTVFAGVPEPTTWAFMILGFGAIGGAMRRRPRTTVAYA